MKIVNQALIAILTLTLVAVILSKSTRVTSLLEAAFSSVSSWISSAMGANDATSSNSSDQSSNNAPNLLSFPTLQALMVKSFQTGDSAQIANKAS